MTVSPKLTGSIERCEGIGKVGGVWEPLTVEWGHRGGRLCLHKTMPAAVAYIIGANGCWRGRGTGVHVVVWVDRVPVGLLGRFLLLELAFFKISPTRDGDLLL